MHVNYYSVVCNMNEEEVKTASNAKPKAKLTFEFFSPSDLRFSIKMYLLLNIYQT